jgi:hypothetical protein
MVVTIWINIQNTPAKASRTPSVLTLATATFITVALPFAKPGKVPWPLLATRIACDKKQRRRRMYSTYTPWSKSCFQQRHNGVQICWCQCNSTEYRKTKGNIAFHILGQSLLSTELHATAHSNAIYLKPLLDQPMNWQLVRHEVTSVARAISITESVV